jgi:hypothetical protein
MLIGSQYKNSDRRRRFGQASIIVCLLREDSISRLEYGSRNRLQNILLKLYNHPSPG